MKPSPPMPAPLLPLVVIAFQALFAAATPALAQAASCTRADFEGVVVTASATLRDMTQRNTPSFQDKLRQLKDKRNWTYEQFVKEAAPLVADEKIADFDARSADYLTQINTMSGEASTEAKPDCRLLETLRENMTALVDTQTQKWSYMFGRLDEELAK
jgi:hypothetical protein